MEEAKAALKSFAVTAVSLKVIFDHLGPSEVLHRVQNFQKEGVWERQSDGKLNPRTGALFAQQWFFLVLFCFGYFVGKREQFFQLLHGIHQCKVL